MKSSSIKVEVSGGLANQIFMFLGGKWIANQNSKTPTVVWIPNSIHSESLFDYAIPYEITKSSGTNRRILRVLKKISKLGSNLNKILLKFGYFFTAEIGYPLKIPQNTNIRYISGYFQSYEIYDQTLSGLSIFDFLNYSPSRWTQNFTQNFISHKDVAIHVRLGDYLFEDDTIGLVGINYYKAAIRQAIENGASGTIRVITNDIDECKKFLEPLPYIFEYVEQPKDVSNFESLYILSRHNFLVLSNSSFSLLAGLESKATTIIRPIPWFKNLAEPSRLSPPEWISISSAWR
jgi:hypothetical protein